MAMHGRLELVITPVSYSWKYRCASVHYPTSVLAHFSHLAWPLVLAGSPFMTKGTAAIMCCWYSVAQLYFSQRGGG
jgi:hypothetical protein